MTDYMELAMAAFLAAIALKIAQCPMTYESKRKSAPRTPRKGKRRQKKPLNRS